MMRCCGPSNDAALESIDLVDTKPVVELPHEKPLWMQEILASEEAAKIRMEELVAKREADAVAMEAARQKKKHEKEAEAAEAALKASAPDSPKAASPKKKTAKKVAKEAEVVIDMSSARYELEVKIVSARDLRNADWITGTSDPFCLCEATGTSKDRFRTKVVSDRTDPVWNQAAKMTVSHGEAIKFTVFDKDVGKADDMLGWVELAFSQMATGFESELKLKDSSDSAKASNAALKVRVKVLRSFTVEGGAQGSAPPKDAPKGTAAKAKAKATPKAA
ncbi:unnamed protein product [Polarella glacialis]|uniref:C2 domain-containing protein n=1 Tax=Polarella glacialis TaxID=89957 RepID=A0A813HJ20_POLGL|nr:unnamed protein product [Polarella glacialis]CAE8660297.1 unnamed protein product [Polarella glacialis]